MDKEPKISEIEKLIKHFHETNRADELLDVLKEHKIISEEIIPVIEEGTNEFHEEAIVMNNLAVKEGFLKRSGKFYGTLRKAYREKWYVRYSLYYLFIFLITFIFLNTPLLFSRINLNNEKKETKYVTIQELKTIPMAASAPLDPGEVVPAGSQVIIPKINVTAPIVFLESRIEKEIQDALTKGVVHYGGTAKPGEVGNSFITGHSSNYWWIKGSYNYVFVNLDKLEVGDQAKIYHNGKKLIYQVREKKVVEPQDTSVLASTDTPTLTLMTCTPPGTNWKRLIVTLDQVAPKYEKPQLVSKQVPLNDPTNLPGSDTGTIGGLALTIWNFFKNLLGY